MRYVLTKIGLFLLTLWAALTLNFILPRLMPGSPVDAALAKLASNGVPVTNADHP
jgi:peptide/nickel transport system permease protein